MTFSFGVAGTMVCSVAGHGVWVCGCAFAWLHFSLCIFLSDVIMIGSSDDENKQPSSTDDAEIEVNADEAKSDESSPTKSSSSRGRRRRRAGGSRMAAAAAKRQQSTKSPSKKSPRSGRKRKQAAVSPRSPSDDKKPKRTSKRCVCIVY